MNLPNRLTLGRLFLALGLFSVLEMLRHASPGPWRTTLAGIGFVLFLVAAFTDVLDGYLARRRRMTSDFGRIADPFADKILICGSLVFLAATPDVDRIIQPWVVVVILAREFLVTGLRGYLEARGLSFGARAIGKLKMLLQSFLVGGGLFVLGPGCEEPRWKDVLLLIMIATVLVTVYSGWIYIQAARRALAEHSAPAASPPPAQDRSS